MVPSIVGLVGKAGSGKDRFYSIYLTKLEYKQIALGDAVKVLSSILLTKSYPNLLNGNIEEILRIFPSIYQSIFHPEKSSLTRTLIQYVGTEVGRAYNENYWIDLCDPIIKHYLSKNIKIAITDVRFKNEAEYIKSLGGKIIKISGQGKYKENSLEAMHKSEMELDEIPFDYTEEEFIKKFIHI